MDIIKLLVVYFLLGTFIFIIMVRIFGNVEFTDLTLFGKVCVIIPGLPLLIIIGIPWLLRDLVHDLIANKRHWFVKGTK